MLRLRLFKLKIPSRLLGMETDSLMAVIIGWVFGQNFDFKLFPASGLVTSIIWAGAFYFLLGKLKYHLPGQRITHFVRWVLQARHYTPQRDEYPIPLVLPDELFDPSYTKSKIKAQLKARAKPPRSHNQKRSKQGCYGI
jgi:hypothetical protein